MLGEPGGQFVLGEGAVGEVEEGEVEVLLRSYDVPAVPIQKSEGNYQRCAFISIDKRVLSGDSERIGSGEPENIRLISVGKDVARFGESRVLRSVSKVTSLHDRRCSVVSSSALASHKTVPQ